MSCPLTFHLADDDQRLAAYREVRDGLMKRIGERLADADAASGGPTV